MNDIVNKPITASVNQFESSVRACVEDRRVDTIELFAELDAAEREKLAEDAWSIGVRALGNAYSRARETRLEDVGRTLLADIERQLERQLDLQQRTVADALGRFFDPQDGEVVKRLDAFVDDEGVLARFLRSYLGDEHSVLAKTLASHVGEHSELFKKLSPNEKDGLVSLLEARMTVVLEENQRSLSKVLDPLAEDGAVAKLLRALRKELVSADEDRASRLDRAIAALDANDESSALSRLMRETREARQTLLRSLNLQHPDSPLAAIKRTVETMLEAHGQTQKQLLEAQQERQQQLEAFIRESIARFEARKHAEAGSPRGGSKFEDTVLAFIEHATQGGTYVVEPTGNTIGKRRGCKVGDAVIHFGSESAFAGCRVVVEAKRDKSFTLIKALEEMQTARENREAEVGLFVFATSHAPDGFPGFARYGTTMVVTWDPDDPATNPMLHGALLAALAMATRTRTEADEGNLAGLRDIEGRMQTELKRIAKIRAANLRISNSADEIADELRKAERAFQQLLGDAKDTLRALNVELIDEDDEIASPITLPACPRPL
jgi:hypothetical protein